MKKHLHEFTDLELKWEIQRRYSLAALPPVRKTKTIIQALTEPRKAREVKKLSGCKPALIPPVGKRLGRLQDLSYAREEGHGLNALLMNWTRKKATE